MTMADESKDGATPAAPKVPTPTPKSSVISKITGRPIPTGPTQRKPAPAAAPAAPAPGLFPPSGTRTKRGDAQRAEFLATEKRHIGDAMRPKAPETDFSRSVAALERKTGKPLVWKAPEGATPGKSYTPPKTRPKIPAGAKMQTTVTTAKTSRLALKMPDASRFGGNITTAKTDRPKKKAVVVAGKN